jgi:hypothetical protein
MKQKFIMKQKFTSALILLVSSWIALFASQAAASQTVLPVAVFNFESKDEAVRGLGPKVSDLINVNLSTDPNIITVERAELEKVLGEQELGLSGTVSSDTAAKVGNLTGAKVLVTGRVFEADNQLFIVTKIIGTETSRVYGDMVSGPVKGSLADMSAQIAKKIAATIAQEGDTLVAKVKTLQERIQEIKAKLGDKKRGAVYVKITEQHYGRFIIDPAAQTELSLILQQCGFTVVDDKSPQKPDYEITGEAFSAFGMQKGNLQSCRARVEIKVRDAATGKIITEDRQTSVAVDLAENIAAKTALQNAADELAERIIPRLVQ